MPPPKSFNKERFWWVSFSIAISAIFGAYIKSNNKYNSSLEKQNAQKDRSIIVKDSSCAADKRNLAQYYEGVIKGKDSTILALKDDKYRSVLDLLNVKKVNGQIKIQQ